MPLIIFLFGNSNNNNNNNVEAMCTFILSSVFTLFLSLAVLTVSLLYDYYLLVCKAVFLKDRSVSKTVNLWQ